MGRSKQPLPKNWPDGFPYLTSPAYSPSLTKAQLQSCRTKPPATGDALREIPLDLKQAPSVDMDSLLPAHWWRLVTLVIQ